MKQGNIEKRRVILSYEGELEQELLSIKKKLQVTIEKLESSNEELRSTNEELQTSNQELQAEKERITKIFDEQEAITILTNGEEMSSVNRKFFKVFGFDNIESFKKKHGCICSLFKNKIKIKHLKSNMDGVSWLEYINQNLNEIHEVYIDDKNGVERIYVVKVSRKIYDDIQVITFTDILQLKKQESIIQQQSKMASMGEMIGNIAHQWRQPLNALSASISIVNILHKDNELNDDEMANFKDESNELIQKMSTTINDFQNFFRPDKIYSRFKISETINRCTDFIKTGYTADGIKLTIDNNSSLEIESFENELMQVLLVLLNNSYDALLEHRVDNREIKVVSKRVDKIITITIEDNGGGIPQEIIDKIFEPYFTTKFQSDGTGIGLYMAKMIIEESMCGNLEIENYKDGVLATIEFLRK